MKITFTFQDGAINAYPIRDKSFIIGRSPKCNVRVQSMEFSREHCKVEIIGKSIFLTDLNSTHGVVVDNVPLLPGTRTRYMTTQQLKIGDSYVIFDLSSDELTRSIVNIRPLLQSDGQTSVTRIKLNKKEAEEKKRESTQSTVLTLMAWAILLTGTVILAKTALG